MADRFSRLFEAILRLIDVDRYVSLISSISRTVRDSIVNTYLTAVDTMVDVERQDGDEVVERL
jgi:hypothetical protein